MRFSAQAGLDTQQFFPTAKFGHIDVVPAFAAFTDRLNVYVDDLKLELPYVRPARTTNDVVVWIPERLLMFTGDIAFNRGTPFMVQGALASHIAACERVREFGAERIVPGPVCGPEALDGMLDYLRSVRHVAEDGYAAGIPPIEAARKIDLGEFVKLDERECLVANLHLAYSELRAEPSGGPAAAGRHLRRDDRVQRRPPPLLRLATGREPMKLSTDRILTTHTGSLPRPEDLVQLTYAQEEGKPVDHDVMAAAQARAVEQVVRHQAEAGIDVVSDGEMSKPGFTNYLTSRVTGYEGRAAPWVLDDLVEFPDLVMEQYGGEAGAHIVMRNCTGDIRYVGQDTVATDIAALSKAMSGIDVAEGFLPATSPGCFALAAPNLHYDSYEKYLFALARALREEYRAIVQSGLLLQIDCPDLPMAVHTSSWDNTSRRIGYQKYLELHVAALNEAVAGLPPDRMRMHICWGNYEGPHHMDVDLTEVLPAVFEGRPAAIMFEAANPRHGHEWEDLGKLKIPDDKVLIPGVVDVKTNVLEHPRLVAQRIGRFADIAGRERVIAGTDCGFGTFVGFGAINDTVAWLKLGALAEGARLASERLWR